jgi:hypothetical protein
LSVPVTLIVKIEILTGDPHYGRCPPMRPRDRLSSWLRRRDVRTLMQSTDHRKCDDLAS